MNNKFKKKNSNRFLETHLLIILIIKNPALQNLKKFNFQNMCNFYKN